MAHIVNVISSSSSPLLERLAVDPQSYEDHLLQMRAHQIAHIKAESGQLQETKARL